MTAEKQKDVSDVIRTELQRLMSKSMDLRKTIEEAKTNTKKKHFLKKLKKNNIAVMNILSMLEGANRQEPQDDSAE